MMMRRKPAIGVISFFALCLFASGVNASGRKGTSELSFRVLDETVPAGAMAQMKVVTTEVTPISGGRPKFSFDSTLFDGVSGIGMFAPSGEVAGAAIPDGDRVSITYVTTTEF